VDLKYNHNKGYTLPLPWYFKWGWFISISFILSFILASFISVIIPITITSSFYFKTVLVICAFSAGYFWGYKRRKYIEYLKGEKIKEEKNVKRD